MSHSKCFAIFHRTATTTQLFNFIVDIPICLYVCMRNKFCLSVCLPVCLSACLLVYIFISHGCFYTILFGSSRLFFFFVGWLVGSLLPIVRSAQFLFLLVCPVLHHFIQIIRCGFFVNNISRKKQKTHLSHNFVIQPTRSSTEQFAMYVRIQFQK